MKLIVLALLAIITLSKNFLSLAIDPVCSDKVQIACLDDIYYAYPACKKAAE